MEKKFRNPRIFVAFKPEEYDVFRRLAAVTGTTMSKAIHQQLEAVMPVLVKVVESLEAAQRVKGSARARMVAQAVKLHTEMDEVAAHALDQIDLFASAAQGHVAASASERSESAERPGAVGGEARRARKKARPAPAARGAVKRSGKRKRGAR